MQERKFDEHILPLDPFHEEQGLIRVGGEQSPLQAKPRIPSRRQASNFYRI